MPNPLSSLTWHNNLQHQKNIYVYMLQLEHNMLKVGQSISNAISLRQKNAACGWQDSSITNGDNEAR